MFGPADAAPADEDRAGQLQAVASPTGSLSAGTLEQNAPHMTPGLAGRQLSSDGTGSPDERKRTGQQKTRERNRRAQHAYRQRNKVKHQQQEVRIRELESRIADLQRNRQPALLTPEDLDGSGSMVDAGDTQQMPGLPHADGASPSPSGAPFQEDAPRGRENQVDALMARLHAASSANPTGLPQAPCRMRLQIISNTDQAGPSQLDHRHDNLQALVPHPAWQEAAPLPLAQLYSALMDQRMEFHLPLPHMHPSRTVTLGQIAEMPMTEFAAFVAPCAAYLAFCSPFCRDPTTHAGRSFCSMAAEDLCVRIALCELRPADALALSGQHLLQTSGTEGCQAPPVWTTLKDEVGLTEAQRQAVREVRSKYAQSMMGATTETVVRAVDLSASLALQRESYMHLLRVFTVQILTPFQYGHFMARSYPYNPAWGEILISIAEP